MAQRLVGRHGAHEPDQRGNAEPPRLLLQSVTTAALSNDCQRKLVTAGGEHRYSLQCQPHPAGVIQSAHHHSPAATPSPGSPSTLYGQGMDVLGSDKAAGQVLNRLADGTGDRGNQGSPTEQTPGSSSSEPRASKQAGVGAWR